MNNDNNNNNIQQNSKCQLCGDKDETINHIISKYSKLDKKSTRLDMIG